MGNFLQNNQRGFEESLSQYQARTRKKAINPLLEFGIVITLATVFILPFALAFGG